MVVGRQLRGDRREAVGEKVGERQFASSSGAHAVWPLGAAGRRVATAAAAALALLGLGS
jgi:hypothetical protein